MAENNSISQQQNQQQFDTNQQILNPLFAPSAESLRTSYFDVLTSSGSAAPSSFSTTFVAIIVGQFVKDADRTEYAAHYQKFFKRMQTQIPATGPMMDNAGGGGQGADKISGMLLAFKSSFVHVLECPQKIMYAFLNDVASMNSNGLSSESSSQLQDPLPIMTEQARILFLSDDIKKTLSSHTSTSAPQQSQKAVASAISRNFPFWASKIVDSKEDSSPQDWSMMDEQSVDDQITNYCVQLLHVGHNLSQMTKAEMKQAFEDISDRYRGQIPTQTMTLELAALPQILSVKDWQLEFQGKMKITLESELVWPAPKPLLFA